MNLFNQNMWTAVLFLVGTGIQVSGYQSLWLAIACYSLSFGTLLWSLIVTLRVPGGLAPKWHTWIALQLGGKLALHDACRIAYEAARKNGTAWAHAAEKMGGDKSPAGVLDYVATYFGMHVTLIGKRPPSTLDETIDIRTGARGSFEGGAKRLEMNDGHTVFTDLRVNARDVKNVVATMSEKIFFNGIG